MQQKIIDYKIRIHTLPEYFETFSTEDKATLQETRKVYQFVIDSKLIWRIWMIDEYYKKWIEVEFENEEGKDERHSLAIDEGTYRKVDSEEYDIIFEKSDLSV